MYSSNLQNDAFIRSFNTFTKVVTEDICEVWINLSKKPPNNKTQQTNPEANTDRKYNKELL